MVCSLNLNLPGDANIHSVVGADITRAIFLSQLAASVNGDATCKSSSGLLGLRAILVLIIR